MIVAVKQFHRVNLLLPVNLFDPRRFIITQHSLRKVVKSVEIFSKGEEDDKWTLHADGRVSSGISGNDYFAARTLESLREGLPPRDIPEYYRTKAGTGIELGPSFRSLMRLWSEAGEAVAEVALPEGVEG